MDDRALYSRFDSLAQSVARVESKVDFIIGPRIGVFYGKTFPLFVTAVSDVLPQPFLENATPNDDNQPATPAPQKPLLEQMRDALRVRHYSTRRGTETSVLDWARRFILFHNKRHPETMGASDRDTTLEPCRNSSATPMCAQP